MLLNSPGHSGNSGSILFYFCRTTSPTASERVNTFSIQYTDHVFRSCPQHDAPGASTAFFKHLSAHKPHCRKKPPLPCEIMPASPGTPATQSFPAPPHLPPLPPALTRPYSLPPRPPAAIEKRVRFFVQFVKPFSTHTLRPSPALAPMPTAIDNGLPHITVSLGSDPTLDPTLCGLMDTCGALNTGYLKFYLWLMSERPDLVAEFISFDDANPFEPIKLGGAIHDPSDFAAACRSWNFDCCGPILHPIVYRCVRFPYHSFLWSGL
jgi:hypothetical protein